MSKYRRVIQQNRLRRSDPKTPRPQILSDINLKSIKPHLRYGTILLFYTLAVENSERKRKNLLKEINAYAQQFFDHQVNP